MVNLKIHTLNVKNILNFLYIISYKMVILLYKSINNINI